MRISLFIFLCTLYISCKKEIKEITSTQETYTTQKSAIQEKRIVRYPDTTRYNIIKNNFSLTSKNFNVNHIEFSLPTTLEDFQIQFSNIPNDRLKVGYNKKENVLYIDQEKIPYKKTKKGKPTRISMTLDTVSIVLSVNEGASYLTKNIAPTTPYTVMTFKSKKSAMTDVVVSKTKRIWK